MVPRFRKTNWYSPGDCRTIDDKIDRPYRMLNYVEDDSWNVNSPRKVPLLPQNGGNDIAILHE